MVVTQIKSRTLLCVLALSVCVGCATVPTAKPPQPVKELEAGFKDEPAAHALYDKMVETMRNADTMYYQSEYRWEAQGREIGHCTYRIWMKKPNYARVEAARDGQQSGILVGDGDYFWIFWPNGRFRWNWERSGERSQAYERTRLTSYMKEPAPVGRHSIGHLFDKLIAGMSMTILDPSTFHSYRDSLQPYIDGVKSVGAEIVSGEECDGIEVSFMKHQRSWYLWLSRRDHLPRKLKQVVRVSYDIITHEVWSDVRINQDVSLEKFAWKPPEGWEEFRLPQIEEGLLKPGTEAPDFDLVSIDGGRIKLSDYRGKVIWFYVWRAG
jgi:outer membrane lipoprotein-sorting protein